MTIIQSIRAAAIGLPIFIAAAAQAQVAVISCQAPEVWLRDIAALVCEAGAYERLDNPSGYDPSVGDPLGDASRTDPLDGAVPLYAAKCLPDRANNPGIGDKPVHCY